MRIFLDANILFSAAKSDGAIRRLLFLLQQARHDCWIDAYVLDEARRNLAVKAPAGLAALDALLPRLHLAPFQRADPVLAASLPLVEKDRPVLAAAIHNRCAVLVTGDQTHFAALYGQTIHGVTVRPPRSLAETLLGRDLRARG
jgi:predicted nucleic acid-binding protein